MFCYNCGNDCKEDRFCSQCGCRVGKPEDRVKIYPDPPLGVYKSKEGFLEIRKDGIRNCWIQYGLRDNMVAFEHFIPYEDIENVMVSSPKVAGGLYLFVQEKGGLNEFPKDVFKAHDNQATIIFQREYNAIVLKIYDFLQLCVEINKQLDK